MPCYKSLNKGTWLWVLLAAFWLTLAEASAEGISVQRAEGRFSDNGYHITADFDISFNFVVEQALMRGVTLYFVSELTLNRPRWYWMDEEVARSEQTTRLSYNALTRQYRIARGPLFQNFSTLETALAVLGHQASAPVAASLLKKDSNHVVSVRMRLDVKQLPKPLQVNALTGKDWNLDSDWYHLIVRPNQGVDGHGE